MKTQASTVKDYLRRALYVLSACIMIISPTDNLSAFSAEDVFSGSNIPPLVNLDVETCMPGDGGLMSESGENIEDIFNFFLAKELSPVQAAAITGNMLHETGGGEDIPDSRIQIVEIHSNPAIRNSMPATTDDPASLPSVTGWPGNPNISRQPGWGLIQWTPSSKYITFAEKTLGLKPPHTLGNQLEVIWHHMVELTPTSRPHFVNTFKEITDLAEATEVFMTDFLAPVPGSFDSRYANAKAMLDRFEHNNPSVTVNNNGCFIPGKTAGDTTGAIAKALEYTWPEPRHRTDMKPEYEAAIKAAQGRGENVQGIPGVSPPGLDCHIFIKRVMRDSGVDPSYSNGLMISQASDYMSNSNKYKEYNPQTSSDLIPGTIVVYYIPGTAAGAVGRHIFMYVGENDQLQGPHNTVAEASVAPQAAPRSGWSDPMGGQHRQYHRYFQIVGSTSEDVT